MNSIKGKVDNLGWIPEDFEISQFKSSAVAWDKDAFLNSDVGRQYKQAMTTLYQKGLTKDHEIKTARIAQSIKDRGLLEISQRIQTNFYESDFELFVKGFPLEKRHLFENALANPFDRKSRATIDKFKKVARDHGFLELEKTIELKFNHMKFKDFIVRKGYANSYKVALSDPLKYKHWLRGLQSTSKNYDSAVSWELWKDYKMNKYAFEANRWYSPQKAEYIQSWIKYNKRRLFEAMKSPLSTSSKEFLDQSTQQLKQNGFDDIADMINEDYENIIIMTRSI